MKLHDPFPGIFQYIFTILFRSQTVFSARFFAVYQGQVIYSPMENWNIYASGNYRITNQNNAVNTLQAYGYDVAGNPYPLSVSYSVPGHTAVSEFNQKENFVTSNIYFDYSFDLNEGHNFKVIAGFNSELNKYRNINAGRTGLITRDVISINTATGNFTNAGVAEKST